MVKDCNQCNGDIQMPNGGKGTRVLVDDSFSGATAIKVAQFICRRFSKEANCFIMLKYSKTPN